MAYDVRAVANFVLKLAEGRGIALSNLTINKIVYFLHAEYLARTDKPLVTAKIEAWPYGPVFRELYAEFKQFGPGPITKPATARDPLTLEKQICSTQFTVEDVAFLTESAERYAKLSASVLVEMSHAQGGPWHEVYYSDGELSPGMRISDERIKTYFGRQTRH